MGNSIQLGIWGEWFVCLMICLSHDLSLSWFVSLMICLSHDIYKVFISKYVYAEQLHELWTNQKKMCTITQTVAFNLKNIEAYRQRQSLEWIIHTTQE